MTKLRSRKQREKCNEVIIEGHRLIKDALKAGLVPSTILYNNPDDVKQFNFPADVVQYKVPYQTLQLWSSLTTCPGLLGIIAINFRSNFNVSKLDIQVIVYFLLTGQRGF